MQSAPLPADEKERLQALHDLQVLDSGAEEEFDALIRVAALVCGVPISLISLVDTERQWFKASIGLPGVSETPRDVAFCSHAILDRDVFEVPDATQDPRFHDNPLVTSAPDIRFYAGAPVVLDSGHRVGTLCIIDRKPGQLNAQQRQVLQSLATAAAKALEGRRAIRELQVIDAQLQREQAALREAKERMRLATEAGGIGIWDYDAVGNTSGADEQTYRLYGHASSHGKAAATFWSDQVHPDDIAGLRKAFARTLVEGVPYQEEFRVRLPDGRERYLRNIGRPTVDAEGRVVRVLGASWDVTDIALRAQHLQQAKEAAEQASRSKGQFLANMSHEIRTPMNAILGMLELLQGTELTTRQRDYTSKTEDAARSLLGLINDILDYSKVEAGKMVLEHEAFTLEKLLRGLAVVLAATVGRKDVEVLFDVDPALPVAVLGDAMRLHQVLVNLGSNAVKFTESGEVVVSLQLKDRTPTHARIAFAVKDSGIGIASENQERIFSGFTQAEASTTRRYGGTGLGLAISQRLVQLMGSALSLDSVVGKGSTFSFEVEFALPAADEPSISAPSDLARRHALVIDDNPLAAGLIRRMVTSLGWECTVAESGSLALQWLRERALPLPLEQQPHVIYVDWQMAGMDGWETIQQIHALYAQARQPCPAIIMVTAHGRQTLAQRTQQEQEMLGGFLAKPLTAQMLREAYDGALSGNTGLRRSGRGASTQRRLLGMRILVVEDNLINQQVAEELLSVRGALVSLAANGQAGVDAVASAAPQFDAVLMDIQMPVMDGYAATRVIRENLGLMQLPIIAMTANAMASDREACLAAGMDEHVGKPFNIDQLVSVLLRVTGFQSPDSQGTNPLVARAAAVRQAPEVEGLDLAQALERIGGMVSLYVRTAQEFMQTLDQGVEPVQLLLQGDDRAAAVRLLHTLKGNAGTLGAQALSVEAGRLEYLLRALDEDTALELRADKLGTLMEQARGALEQAVAQLQPATAATAAVAPARGWLQSLHARLVQEDFAALDALAQGREHLATFPAGFSEALEQALQALDWAQAAQLCAQQLAQP